MTFLVLICDNNMLTFLRSLPFWQGPTAPQIFFGRDAELAQIVQMVTTNTGSHPARIAILGLGGYGKTTLARAVLTAKQIQDHFGDARHFVPCESVTSSGALLTELGKTLAVLEGRSDTLWSRIQMTLTSKDSIICFDNFESPWDQNVEIKHVVEELLSRVTGLPRVTVLITMRGAERPAQTQWTQPFLEPLETLGHDSAKQIWQAISRNYNDFSEKLIEAVDYVPLAVDLLSHLSQVTPPELLWEEWSSKQTKAIQTGQGHRLSNLEYSIQLSINSGRMKTNPSSRNLLGVLSMLPDGLHVKQLRKFKGMFVDLDVTLCLQTLLQCSLIKIIKERYQPHPIVRHFCLKQEMVLPLQKIILEDFYVTLGALSASNIASPEAYEEMLLEANNIKATLLRLLESNYGDQSRLIHACLQFTTFCANIGDLSEKLMSQAVQFIEKNSLGIDLLIMSFQQWGKLYYWAGIQERAEEKMQEAEKLCLSGLGVNSELYGQILGDLGEIYHQKDAFSDAEACYKKALELHQDERDVYREGTSYSGLGYLYLRQGKLSEASAWYQSAIQCHQKANATVKLGSDYSGLGQIYMQQHRPNDAEAALQQALNFHRIGNSFLDQGHDYSSLGTLYLKINKLEDAIAAGEKALKLYMATNYTTGQGEVYMLFGNIYLHQGKLDEAERSFKTALELYTMTMNAWGLGQGFSSLRHIYMIKRQLDDAKGMFEKALDFHKKYKIM